MKTNGERRPEEILADIDRTRTDIDDTLQAIEQRLTPGQLVDQGLAYLRRSNAREFASNLGRSVRDNPLPVALVGIGIAWLMVAGRSDGRTPATSTSTFEDDGPGLGERAEDAIAQVADTKDRAVSAARAAKDRVGATVDNATQKARTARKQLGDTAHAARERIGNTAHAARERAAELRDTAREQVDRARGGYDRMVREQPLALGAIGLAVGAVLAAAAPRTRQEDRLMGQASDRLADEAKQAVSEQVDKATDVAEAARDAAQDEWRNVQQTRELPSGSDDFGAPEPESDVRTVPSGPH